MIALGAVFLWFKVGKGLVPAFFPPKENTAEQLEKAVVKQSSGQKVDFPLKIDGSFEIRLFAKDLTAGARVLAFDKNQNLLVSLPDGGKVIALPDSNRDGKADKQITILQNLNRPHGLAFYEGFLYVAQENEVVQYKYDPDQISASDPKKILDLPSGGGHSSRTIKFGPDGKLYITAGSSCNICEEKDNRRAAMMRADPDGSNFEIFAKGLRNTVFFTFDESGQIWGNDMGRDLLGDQLPPDELNIIQKGGDYGWPYCNGKSVVDPFGKSEERCKSTISPHWNYHAHIAPLGITFINSGQFPDEWQGDLLASFHGSWNSSVPVGYKIVLLEVEDGKVVAERDFVTGFITGSVAAGRPVDLIFGSGGSLFISDDKSNAVYILRKKS
ncbi:MAG: PQQ-dependent sugar dehydrogenase [Candidatus Woykebacteria bacterium]